MVHFIHLPLQGLIYISVAKGQYVIVSRFRFYRDANFIAARGIISRFLGILNLVQLTVGDLIVLNIEHNLVLLLQGLHIFLNFLLHNTELLKSSTVFS